MDDFKTFIRYYMWVLETDTTRTAKLLCSSEKMVRAWVNGNKIPAIATQKSVARSFREEIERRITLRESIPLHGHIAEQRVP